MNFTVTTLATSAQRVAWPHNLPAPPARRAGRDGTRRRGTGSSGWRCRGWRATITKVLGGRCPWRQAGSATATKPNGKRHQRDRRQALRPPVVQAFLGRAEAAGAAQCRTNLARPRFPGAEHRGRLLHAQRQKPGDSRSSTTVPPRARWRCARLVTRRSRTRLLPMSQSKWRMPLQRWKNNASPKTRTGSR